jgi:hypothetical protein
MKNKLIVSQTYRCVSTFKEYCGSGSDGSVVNGLDQNPVHPDPHYLKKNLNKFQRKCLTLFRNEPGRNSMYLQWFQSKE